MYWYNPNHSPNAINWYFTHKVHYSQWNTVIVCKLNNVRYYRQGNGVAYTNTLPISHLLKYLY